MNLLKFPCCQSRRLKHKKFSTLNRETKRCAETGIDRFCIGLLDFGQVRCHQHRVNSFKIFPPSAVMVINRDGHGRTPLSVSEPARSRRPWG